MRTLAVLIICQLMIMSCNGQDKLKSGNIDGKTFFIETLMPDGTSAGKEFIYFKNGTIEGSECSKYGYDKPTYSVDENGVVTAVMHSPEQGALYWSGTVQDKIFSGTAIWKKAGQDDIKMTFSGELQ